MGITMSLEKNGNCNFVKDHFVLKTNVTLTYDFNYKKYYLSTDDPRIKIPYIQAKNESFLLAKTSRSVKGKNNYLALIAPISIPKGTKIQIIKAKEFIHMKGTHYIFNGILNGIECQLSQDFFITENHEVFEDMYCAELINKQVFVPNSVYLEKIAITP